jgi:hypothetical protein
MDDHSEQLQVRFASEPAFIEELATELATVEGFTEISQRSEEDPSALGFDFGLVTVLIGLGSDLFFSEPLVPLLWRVIRRKRPQRIRIDTPLGTASFEPHAEMTEDEIRRVVRQLAEVYGSE